MQAERKSEYERLKQFTHRNLLQLLDSELNLALTMTELAETESSLGEEPHARVLLERVQQALDTVRRHLTGHDLSEHEIREIEGRLKDASDRLQTARQQILEPRSAP